MIVPFGMIEVFWASLKSFQEPVMVGKLLYRHACDG
jgi:hypothetical protein